jgi:sugar-specific transcriptional regulator TrmB
MDSIDLLKKFGLTEYESRVYNALAQRGPSKVKDLVLTSGVPRNKVYESLSSLEKKNKVMSLPISPKKYILSDPSAWEDTLEELNLSMQEFIKQLSQPTKQESHDLFWIIKGKKAIEERLAQQNRLVKKEILGCNNLSKILYTNLRELEHSVKRGVRVKLICTFDKKKIQVYKEWLSTGANIRVLNQKMFGPLLPRISIFDGNTARLTIGQPEVQSEEEYITLWTESKVFSQMLRNHFLNMWKHSKSLKTYLAHGKK